MILPQAQTERLRFASPHSRYAVNAPRSFHKVRVVLDKSRNNIDFACNCRDRRSFLHCMHKIRRNQLQNFAPLEKTLNREVFSRTEATSHGVGGRFCSLRKNFEEWRGFGRRGTFFKVTLLSKVFQPSITLYQSARSRPRLRCSRTFRRKRGR